MTLSRPDTRIGAPPSATFVCRERLVVGLALNCKDRPVQSGRFCGGCFSYLRGDRAFGGDRALGRRYDGEVGGWRAVVLGAAIGAVVACRSGEFVCQESDDCATSRGGVCQSDGFCSFPDGTCPSGQRYGEHSGALSNECVPPGSASTGTGDGDVVSTSTTAGSGDPSAADGETGHGSGTTSPAVDSSGSLGSSGETGPGSEGSSGSSGASSSSSGGGPSLDPDLRFWFTFDDDPSDGLDNSGVLGGTAACSGDACPTATVGVLGSGATFDGSDDCAEPGAGDVLVPDAEFSVATWVRLEDYPVGTSVIIGQAYGTGVLNTWDLAVTSNGRGAEFVFEGILDAQGLGVSSLSVDVGPLSTWHHVVATHSPTQSTLWIDGALANQAAGHLLVSDQQPLLIGCDDEHQGGFALYLGGALDDLRVYARVLTPAEIAGLAAG